LVVVGGGILGALHAWHGRRNGFEVVHLERDAAARGASVRNFGLVWVSGRAAGDELALAQRARELWDEIGADVPSVGLRASGSLTVALNHDEWLVLKSAADLPDAQERRFELVEAADVTDRNPAVRGAVLGGLWCARDALVEPRSAARAIVARLAEDDGYRWHSSTMVVDVRDGRVRDDEGTWWEGDLVVVCPGAADGRVSLLGSTVPHTGPAELRGPVDVLVRPEGLTLSTDRAGDAIVTSKSFRGAVTRVGARLSETSAVWVDLSSAAAAAFAPGDPARISLTAATVLAEARS
jgi:glycine/D-amino acid oxidase-like deaminating enzyme